MRVSKPVSHPSTSAWLATLPICLALASPLASQDPPWRSSGPLCAGISAIAFAGGGSNRVYAATDDALSSALFVSENNGARWEKLPNQPPAPAEILDIEAHPADDRIVFVTSRGVVKSENRGRTWASIAKGLPRLAFTRGLRIDPLDPQTMFVLADRRLYKTSNGGRRWRLAAPTRDIGSYVLHPRDSRLLWLTDDQGVQRSTDGGRSWTPNADFRLDNALLAVDPSASTTLYAATSGLLFQTTDGSRWDFVGTTPDGARFLSVDPSEPSQLLLGTSASRDKPSLWRSTNGGKSWRGLDFNGVTPRALARHPDRAKIILIGADLGLYRSKRSGRSAKPASSGLHGGRTLGLATLPPATSTNQTPVSYTRSWLCGLFSRDARSAVWRSVDRRLGPVREPLAVSPLDPKILYRGTRSSLAVSDDGGETWSSVRYGEGGSTTTDVEVSLADPLRIYAAVQFGGLYVSRDGGQTLSLIDRSVIGLNQAATVALHPTSADTVLVGGFGGLARSTDSGTTWQKVHDDSVDDITIDPLRPDTIFALRSDHRLIKSTDGGSSWSQIGLDLPASAKLLSILADGLNADTVYLATSVGVLRSTDSGQSWSPFSKGLPDISSFLFPEPTPLALSANGELLLATLDGVYSVGVH